MSVQDNFEFWNLLNRASRNNQKGRKYSNNPTCIECTNMCDRDENCNVAICSGDSSNNLNEDSSNYCSIQSCIHIARKSNGACQPCSQRSQVGSRPRAKRQQLRLEVAGVAVRRLLVARIAAVAQPAAHSQLYNTASCTQPAAHSQLHS